MTVQPALSTATRIGWIGTGVMGSSMCGHILTAGYRVTVHSRTKSKAQPLVDLGATWAENPRTVAAQSDMIFTMVGFPQDVRTVYFGETGILAGAQAGTITHRYDDDGTRHSAARCRTCDGQGSLCH